MARPKKTTTPTRKAQLLQQAAILFKINGYNATTMRHLAEHMGMEAASLYNHIRSKEEILHNICTCVAKDFMEHLASIQDTGMSPAEKIEEIIRFHIHMQLNRFDDVYVMNRDWKHLTDAWRNAFVHQRRQYEKSLAEIIQAGISQKQFKKVNPHMAVITLLSAVRGLEYWQRNKHFSSAKQATADMTTLLLNGLKN